LQTVLVVKKNRKKDSNMIGFMIAIFVEYYRLMCIMMRILWECFKNVLACEGMKKYEKS